MKNTNNTTIKNTNMKKYIFVLVSMILVNYMAAQGVNQYGAIVKDATLNTLKVGNVSYPDTIGDIGQVLTVTQGNPNTTSWQTPSSSFIPSVYVGNDTSLTNVPSGSTIAVYGGDSVDQYPQNDSLFLNTLLVPGYSCTIINYSMDLNITINGTSNSSNPIYFYTKNFKHELSFTIPAGGTVKLNVIYVDGIKYHFLLGDAFLPT